MVDFRCGLALADARKHRPDMLELELTLSAATIRIGVPRIGGRHRRIEARPAGTMP